MVMLGKLTFCSGYSTEQYCTIDWNQLDMLTFKGPMIWLQKHNFLPGFSMIQEALYLKGLIETLLWRG